MTVGDNRGAQDACAAIPFSVFADAVEKYEADSEADDEGDMVIA